MSFTVYGFFDADDQCVYVGQTSDLPARIKSHGRRFGDATWRALSVHATRDEAIAAEREAIKSVRPVANVHHNPTPPVRDISEDSLLSTSKAAKHMGVTAGTLARLFEPAGVNPDTGRRWYTLRSIRRQLDDTDGGAAA